LQAGIVMGGLNFYKYSSTEIATDNSLVVSGNVALGTAGDTYIGRRSGGHGLDVHLGDMSAGVKLGVVCAITADRKLTIPTLTADDTLAVLGLAQTFTGDKTFSGKTAVGEIAVGTATVSFGDGSTNTDVSTAGIAFLRVDISGGNGTATLAGLANPVAGKVVIITHTPTGTGNLALPHESGSESTAANRLLTTTGGTLTLTARQMAIAIYDGSSSRWRVAKWA
jgi:hypothetical protein